MQQLCVIGLLHNGTLQPHKSLPRLATLQHNARKPGPLPPAALGSVHWLSKLHNKILSLLGCRRRRARHQ